MNINSKFYKKYAQTDLVSFRPLEDIEELKTRNIPPNSRIPSIEEVDLEKLEQKYDAGRELAELRLKNLKKRQKEQAFNDAFHEMGQYILNREKEKEPTEENEKNTMRPTMAGFTYNTIIPGALGEEDNFESNINEVPEIPINEMPEIPFPEDLENSPLNKNNYPRDKAKWDIILKDREENGLSNESDKLLKELKRFVRNMDPVKKSAQLVKLCTSYYDLCRKF